MDKTLADRRQFAQDRANHLKDAGFTIDTVDEYVVIGHTKTLVARIELANNCIYFGRAKSFDRWANSRDYVFEGIPETREDLEIVTKIAADFAENAVGEDFESISLNTHWRKYKKAAAKEDFEQKKRVHEILGNARA